MKARLDELEKMMTVTEVLKGLERDLNRWLSRIEADFTSIISTTPLSDSNSAGERTRQIQVGIISF